MSIINGLIVALTTPFKSGGIDIEALQQHILLVNTYAKGFALGGTTGESLSLTDDELVTLLQASSAVVGDQLLIAGFWRLTTEDVLTTIKKVADHADVLLIPIPKELFQENDATIAEYYAQIAKTTFKPILIYNYPAKCDGRAISAELAATIATNNINIIGVKDSSSDAQLTKDIIINNLPLQPILGNDRFIFEVNKLMQEYQSSYPVTSITGASSVPAIARKESEIYSLCAEKNYSQAEVVQQDLINNYFNTWLEQSLKLGGQAPIFKSLIATELPDYPIQVRAPLKPM